MLHRIKPVPFPPKPTSIESKSIKSFPEKNSGDSRYSSSSHIISLVLTTSMAGLEDKNGSGAEQVSSSPKPFLSLTLLALINHDPNSTDQPWKWSSECLTLGYIREEESLVFVQPSPVFLSPFIWQLMELASTPMGETSSCFYKWISKQEASQVPLSVSLSFPETSYSWWCIEWTEISLSDQYIVTTRDRFVGRGASRVPTYCKEASVHCSFLIVQYFMATLGVIWGWEGSGWSLLCI